MFMIMGDNTSSITPASTVMGILMDNELLLLDAVQGKGVLRSLQLPADVSEPGALAEIPLGCWASLGMGDASHDTLADRHLCLA